MKKIIFLLLVLSLLLGCCLPPPTQKAKWTIMVYIDSDNNLELAALWDIDEMEMVGSTDDVKVVIQWDRIPGYDSSNGDWTGTKRFLIKKDMQEEIVASEEIMDLGEVDMADASSLSDFIKWSMENYPAERYALFMWNHGGGWTSHTQDETNESEANLHTLSAAFGDALLRQGRGKLDLIMFDQCLMGQIDVAYAVAPYAKVLVASEDTIPFLSIDYSPFLNSLNETPSMDEKAFAREIVESYENYYTNERPNPYTTLSAIDLTKMDEIKVSFSNFVNSLNESAQQQWPEIGKSLFFSESFATPEGIAVVKQFSVYDLIDFADLSRQKVDSPNLEQSAQNLKTAIQNSIIAEYHNKGHPFATGLTMYFPDDEILYRPEYPEASEFAKDTGWDEFIRNYIALENTDTIAPQVKINEVSSTTASIGNPVSISGVVTGNNIISVYRIIGYVQGDNIFMLSSWPLEYTTKTYEDGRRLPDFVDGENPIIYDWGASSRILKNGTDQTVAPIQPFGRATYFYAAQGEYLRAGETQPFDAVLLFDLRHGGLLGALQIIETPAGATEKEFLPLQGDQFTPYMEVYNMQTMQYSLAKADPITLGENGIWVDFSLVPEGQYVIGVFVQDVTGNAMADIATVNVAGQPEPNPSISINNLVGRWIEAGVLLEINADGSCKTVAGATEKPCTYWFRNDGLPLLSLFSDEDETMFIHFVVDAEQNKLILTEVLGGDRHTFWREGVEPTPEEWGIDSELIGKWENQVGFIEFEQDGGYEWKVAEHHETGEFKTSDGKLRIIYNGRTTDYSYRILNNSLTITDPEGGTITYTKSTGVQPPQPPTTGLVGKWYNPIAAETVEFKADGSYTSTIFGTVIAYGTWQISGNTLLLNSNYGPYSYVFQVEGDTLTIYEPTFGAVTIYQRVG